MTTLTAARWNGVDHDVVRTIRAQVADAMREELQRREADGPLDEESRLQLGFDLIERALAGRDGDRQALASAVHAEMWGAGRLQRLLDDPLVANIDLYGCDRVRVTLTSGEVIDGPPVADSDAELEDLVRRLAMHRGALSSRAFDNAHPWVRLRLPGGSRLSAITAVVARPSVSIRCYRLQPVNLVDLHGMGGFVDQVGAFLEAAVRARFNLMISGETFAGKTTLLRALGADIPLHERIITVEEFRELGFADLRPDGDVVELEARPANAEGAGAVSMGTLVELARQQNPDRLIVGEVMGGREVLAMLDAMTQGEDGSLSTIHARSSLMVFQRIASYALTAGLPVQACHLLTAGALDFVIHLAKRPDSDGRPRRFVQSIREVVGHDGSQVVSSEVFKEAPGFKQAPAAPITGDRALRLAAAGYDERVWMRP
jgi:Flp pilus assembly CpaF family ATPase